MLDDFEEAFPEALNVTSEAIDFEGIDEDLASFQEDEMVKQALQRGVDLRKYADELERELRDVRAVACEGSAFWGVLVAGVKPN